MEIIKRNNNGQFDIIRWLALATSKDKLKRSLHCINVGEKQSTATSGHILNQYNKPLSLEPGLYEVCKITKSEVHLLPSDERFPDTDSVFPDKGDLAEIDLHGQNGDSYRRDETLGSDFTLIIRAMKEYALNYELFKIVADGASLVRAYIHPKTNGSAVLLSSAGGTRVSLIMPIRTHK